VKGASESCSWERYFKIEYVVGIRDARQAGEAETIYINDGEVEREVGKLMKVAEDEEEESAGKEAHTP
jgi:hypothetical protein